MDPPFRVTPYVWESQPGRLSLTIACELAFRLVHGSDAQPIEPVRFYDDDLAATALADVRAPYKPRCDLLVVGHAFTPVSGPEVERMLVRVRVGEFTKAVRVTGDRLWQRGNAGITPGPPRPWRRMLLSPERSARTAENPRGMDAEAVRMEHRMALPNIEATMQGQEAYLGPVPSNAPRRASLLHPRAGAWAHALFSGQRAGPPPDHFAFGYFNIAPSDQQLSEIPFGAAIALEGLNPEHSLLTSRLPATRLRGYVYDHERRGHVEAEMRIDTLWVDADREVVSIVVRGLVPVSHPDAAKHITVRFEPFQRTDAPRHAMFETHAINAPVTPDLPFAKTGASPPVQEAASGDPGTTSRLPRLDLDDNRGSPRESARRNFITQEILLDAPTAATPFETKVEEDTTQNLGKPRTQTDEPPPPVIRGDDSTEDPTPPPRTVGLGGLRLGPLPRVHAPADAPDLENTDSGEPTSVVATSGPVATPLIVKLVAPDIPPTPSPPLPPKPSDRSTATAADSTPPKPAIITKRQQHASQARLGMLHLGAAKLESAPKPPDETTSDRTDDSKPRPLGEESTETRAPVGHAIEARTLEEAEAEAERDAFEFPLPPSDGFEVDGVTLEHCAAVRAMLAIPGATRADVLAKNDLDEAAWTRIEKAHMARIDQETSKGISDLLNRYDAAYVAAQDKLRRPIGVKEYARITVARDQGRLAEALSELAIPRSELMRLDRVWKQRRLAHPEVDKALVAAVDSLKAEQ